MTQSGPVLFERRQRVVALAYGGGSLALFAASVVVMFVSLYRGLNLGWLHLHGVAALLINTLLLVQFAAGHSWLLSDSGRKFMKRLAPFGLGGELSTTIFAAFASAQLLATFALWSPSGVIWAVPEGGIKTTLTVLYGISWVLLAKSMHDAGLDVQIGTVGWRSVWRNQKPVYRPFTRTGLFRHSRQPIYAAFTLILWTAPVWTPDHLFIAIVWTGYCVFAPLIKERRYLRFYGDAFARYQKAVPYWFPGRKSLVHASSSSPNTDHDVAIVGAGPVGLLLAGLLGRRGLRVLVIEKRTEAPSHSQAIGITPPSLHILAQLGLDDAFRQAGVPIRDCHVHGETGYLGCASFRDIPDSNRFILSLPQQINVRLLEEKAASFPNVTLRRGVGLAFIQQDDRSVTLALETEAGDERTTAAWVVGCDGHRSRVRDLIRMRASGGNYRCHFVMGDFIDKTDLADDAHLYFTADGAVESFPLPEGKRRWIVQTKTHREETEPGFISDIVSRRSGIDLPAEDQLTQSAFTPRWMQCEQYYDGRVLLCGDSAHLMSPIGGQGMNTGWADAEFAAQLLEAVLREGQDPLPWLRAYDRCRRKASDTSIRRAARGMWLGTWTGRPASLLRDVFMRNCLFKGPLSHRIGAYFAMITIPYNTLEHVPRKRLGLPTATS